MRGTFDIADRGYEHDFEEAGSEFGRIAPNRDAIETFIMERGEWADVQLIPEETRYPWVEEGYEPLSLPDEHDGAEDDSANKYAFDSVDARI